MSNYVFSSFLTTIAPPKATQEFVCRRPGNCNTFPSNLKQAENQPVGRGVHEIITYERITKGKAVKHKRAIYFADLKEM